MGKPGPLQSYFDPAFVTRIARVNDAPYGTARHTLYNTVQPWNADESQQFTHSVQLRLTQFRLRGHIRRGSGSAACVGLSDSLTNNQGCILDSLLHVGKRVLIGESIFMTHFTNAGTGKKRVAFAAPYPGNIIALDMASFGEELISGGRQIGRRVSQAIHNTVASSINRTRDGLSASFPAVQENLYINFNKGIHLLWLKRKQLHIAKARENWPAILS